MSVGKKALQQYSLEAKPIVKSAMARIFKNNQELSQSLQRQKREKYYARRHHVQRSSAWPSIYAPREHGGGHKRCLSSLIKYEGDMLLEDIAIRKFVIAMLPRSIGFQRLVMDDPIIHRTGNQITVVVTCNTL